MTVIRQIPTIVLPQAGAGTEAIADTAQHLSITMPAWALQEKQANVIAAMVGAPGPLNCWVEISSTGVAGTWAMVGVPSVLAAAGNIVLAWTVHSEYARIVLQAPALVAPNAWVATVIFEAKTP